MFERGDIMLCKFSVEGFKGFKNKIVFNLSNPNDYQFNSNLIKNGIIKNAFIYGKNASGKSNIGLALFDLIFHLTDKNKSTEQKYVNYLNLDTKDKFASFCYEFKFNNDKLVYSYKKDNIYRVLYEEISYNDKVILKYDFVNTKDKIIEIDEAKTLNWKYNDENISIVKYIVNNTKLKKDNPLSKLMDFVNGMLWFRSVEANAFIGLRNTSNTLENIIFENAKLEDFQKFLKDSDIDYKLYELNETSGRHLGVKFENGHALFESVISTGTRSLWLFYCWKIFFSDVKFLFIDEFDANYHFELAAKIIQFLNEQNNFQSVVTSHNTYLMSNKHTRPDCTFIISNDQIKNLSNCTEKELREAHNIEKLYREGLFRE